MRIYRKFDRRFYTFIDSIPVTDLPINLDSYFCLQNGYPARRRSLVDDARFETLVVKQTKQSVLEEARQRANGELCMNTFPRDDYSTCYTQFTQYPVPDISFLDVYYVRYIRYRCVELEK